MSFETDLNNASALKEILDEKEELYQTLWQQYFQSVNIKARKNMKLHIQHMPKRYWKYLVERVEEINKSWNKIFFLNKRKVLFGFLVILKNL